MRLRLVSLVAAGVLAVAAPAPADRMAIPVQPPAVRAVTADAVVVGTVTAIETDPVEVEAIPGAKKAAYKVAVVKIGDGIAGVDKLTHLKIGFRPYFPPPPGGPRESSRPIPPPQLVVGQEGCFFLTRHPAAGFYTLDPRRPALDTADKGFKDEMVNVKAAAAVAADPMKALAAAKAADRYFAAAVLLTKYRSGWLPGGGVDKIPIPAGESRLILKTLAEKDDWGGPAGEYSFDAPRLVAGLLLCPEDGWRPMHDGKGDFNTYLRDYYRKWLAADGVNYAVKKFVPKGK